MLLPFLSRSSLAVLALATLAGCTKTGSVNGRVVDAISGKAVGDIKVNATATVKPKSPSCNTFETLAQKDGTFTINGLCEGVTYRLGSLEKTRFISGPEVAGGVPADKVVDAKAWFLPLAENIYLATGGEPAQIRQNVVIGSSKILDSQDEVLYPKEFPKGIKVITPGTYLLVNGKTRNEKIQLLPVLESGERKFGTTKAPEKSEPWWYIGVRFNSDTEVEKVEAQVDKAKIVELKDDTRHATFYAYDAVPAGYYMLMAPKETRAYLVRFGEPSTATAKPEEAKK
jgi:hypothetical protein